MQWTKASKGLSDRDVAERLGWRRVQVSKVLSGHRGVDGQGLDALRQALVSPISKAPLPLSPTALGAAWLHHDWPFLAALCLPHSERLTDAEPHLHVDGFVLVGHAPRLRRAEDAFVHLLPLLNLADPATTQPVAFLEHGGRRFYVRNSLTDRVPREKRRYNRYARTIEVVTPAGGDYHVVACIRIGRARNPCSRHQPVRGVKPPAQDPARRQRHPRCPDCEARTRAQDLRLEIKGAGCQLGLLHALVPKLFGDFVAPDSIKVTSVDLALDLAVPYRALVLFEQVRDRASAQRRVWTHWDYDIETTGMYAGTRTSPVQICAYDKTKELRCDLHSFYPGAGQFMESTSGQEGWPAPGLSHKRLPDSMRGRPFVARVEFRFRVNKLKIDGSPTGIFSRLPKIWNRFALADIRDADVLDWRVVLAAFAHTHGASGLAPTPARLRRIDILRARRDEAGRVSDRDTYEKYDGTPDSGVGSGKANQTSASDCIALRLRWMRARKPFVLAAALHDEMFWVLKELASRSGFDLGQAVESQLSRVQAELDSLLELCAAAARPSARGS